MTIINFTQAKQNHQKQLAPTKTEQLANKISNQLISKFAIQRGYGLADFLEVDNNHDNHKAIRVWVSTELNKKDLNQQINKADEEQLIKYFADTLSDIKNICH